MPRHTLIICSIALMLATSAQAVIKDRTFSNYTSVIPGYFKNDINNTKELQKPIGDILTNGSLYQVYWLAQQLTMIEVERLNTATEKQYLNWSMQVLIQILQRDTLFSAVLDGRDPTRSYPDHFYPRRTTRQQLEQAIAFLNELYGRGIGFIQLGNMPFAQSPQLRQAFREQWCSMAPPIEYALFGNFRYCQRALGMRTDSAAVQRIAETIEYEDFIRDPQLLAPYMLELPAWRYSSLVSIESELVLYATYHLSSFDRDGIIRLLGEGGRTLGCEQMVMQRAFDIAAELFPSEYQIKQEQYRMLQEEGNKMRSNFEQFVLYQDSLRQAGHDFVNMPPVASYNELKDDPTYSAYMDRYLHIGYVFCRYLNILGGFNYYRQHPNEIFNLLYVMGYYHESIPSELDWTTRWIYYLGDLIEQTEKHYQLTHESWTISAYQLEHQFIVSLCENIDHDELYYQLARSLSFFYTVMNDEDYMKYLIDTYFINVLPNGNLRSSDESVNCVYIWFYAQILPFLDLYDEPERSKLKKFYESRLSQGVKANPGCGNNPYALLTLADFNYRNKNVKKARKYIDQYLALTGDTATYHLYCFVFAYQIDQKYELGAHYADIINADDPTALASQYPCYTLIPARAYALAGQTEKAMQQLALYRDYARNEIGRSLFTLGDGQSNMLERYNLANSVFGQICIDPISDEIRNEVTRMFYNWQLLTKGLLLTLNSEAENLYAHHPNPYIRDKYARLKQYEAELTAITDVESFQALSLTSNINAAQRELLEAIQQYTDQHGFAGVNLTEWEEVRNALRPGEVAIEFACGDLLDEREDPTYFALLLRAGDEQPTAVRLFRESELMKLIGGKNEMQIYDDTDRNNKVVRMIIHPLESYLHPGDTIYFAAAGALHQIALENMYYHDEQPLADRYYMHRVSSTRQLLSRTDRTQLSPQDSVMLYGGIQYETDNATLKAQSDQYPEQQIAHRAVSTADINRGQAGFLPGSLREVAYIDSLLARSAHPKHMLSGTEANEESFKALSGHDNAILHIATHGFFWPKDSAPNYRYLSASVSEESTLRNIDPMRRCGLLMAGANTALSGRAADLPPGVQDGVLTAQEISLLDLSRTKLVILSACETGIGELNSDGVFGLQRAFKKAGVETLIMSLWKVSDNATQLLMTEFYRNWLNGLDKREAFRRAQNAVRQRYEEPTYWAGFIMLD